MSVLAAGLNGLSRLRNFFEQKSKESESQMIPFAVLGLGLYFIYNLIFNYQNNFESISLEHPEVAVLCFILLLKNYWPYRFKFLLPWYWFACVFYLMPFLMTQLFLQNQDSFVWMLLELSMALLLALLLDWLTYLDFLCLGLVISFVVYDFFHTNSFSSDAMEKKFFLIFFISVLIAVFLLRARNVAQRAQIRSQNLVSAVMAHELRTPLLSMRAGVLAIKKYLPLLVKGYHQALEQNDSLEPIRDDRLEALGKMGDEMVVSLNYSAMVIDALVAGFNNSSVEVEFVSLDVSQAIMSSIEQYPFSIEEINLVELLESPNVKIVGNEAIFVHIFHNLFKYALYKIKEANKGIIKIWVEKKNGKAHVYFECTAAALPEDALKHIFDIAFSDKEKMARIGTCLYLSKAAVERMDGFIDCVSSEESFIFILTFRLADNV
ncbi:MAG TPA: HAMP domain-containing sensor histidine kinase [Coxiellaceae bacterium]|nr:HAMP domain-containing sensor histidine kinase [Coxiellaceae bacterium]